MKQPRRARANLRVPFSTTVELWKHRTPTAVRATDISVGGLFIRTDEPVLEGSYLTLTLSVPGGGRFSALCRVARRDGGRPSLRPAGLGLQFVDVTPSALERIDEWVHHALGRSASL